MTKFTSQKFIREWFPLVRRWLLRFSLLCAGVLLLLACTNPGASLPILLPTPAAATPTAAPRPINKRRPIQRLSRLPFSRMRKH